MGRVLVQQPGTNTTKALSETLPKNVIIVDEDLKELRLHDGVTPGGKIIGQSAGSGVPVGTIIPFAGNSVPQGYLLCDGSAISRTDYASLFAVIGTIYGAGNGNSTFNLPLSSTGDPLLGAELSFVGGSTHGGVPNITGTITVYTAAGFGNNDATGAFELFTGTGRGESYQFSGSNQGFSFDASRISSIYQNGQTKVKSAGIYVLHCIKYI